MKAQKEMDFSHVTLACDDERQETSLKHTKVFQNKNLVQCYHNKRGYCRFRDRCRYFKEICIKNVCRERECVKRHPVICRYKNDCRFNKSNNCAFKHIGIKTTMVNKDFESEMKAYTEKIKNLNREIIDLKNDIDIKKKELFECKMELQQSNPPKVIKQQSEIAVMKENEDLKKLVEILQR